MITAKQFAIKYDVSLRTAQKWIVLAGIKKIADVFFMTKEQELKVYNFMEKEGVFEQIKIGRGRPRKTLNKS